MSKLVLIIALTSNSIHAQVAVQPPGTTPESAYQISKWDRYFLARISPGAQPAVDMINATNHGPMMQIAGISTAAAAAGIGRSTTTSAEETSTGQFWNRAIQKYWNVVTETPTFAHKLPTARDSASEGTFAGGPTAVYDTKYTYDFSRSTNHNPDAGTLHWLPEALNTAPDPLHPGAQPGIVTFHFQTRFTTLLRKIL